MPEQVVQMRQSAQARDADGGRRPAPLAQTLVVVGLGLAVGWLVSSVAPSWDWRSQSLVLSGLLIAMATTPIVVRSVQRRLDLFDPLFLVPVTFIIYYGLRGALLVYRVPQDTPVLALNAGVKAAAPDALPQTLLVSIAALLSFYAGTALASGWLPRFLPRKGSLALARVSAMLHVGRVFQVLGSIAIGATVLALAGVPLIPRGLDFINNVLYAMAILGFATLSRWRWATGRSRRSQWILTVSYCLLFLAIGYRYQIVLLGFVLLCCHHYTVRRLSLRKALLAMALLVFVLTPLTQATRLVNVLHRGEPLAARLAHVPEVMWRYKLNASPERIDPGFGPLVYNFSVGLSDRLYGADTLLVVVSKTPDPNGYIWQERLSLMATTFLLPRAFFSDKPVVSISEYFKRTYWGSEKSDQSNQKPGLLGELYMIRGLLAVLIGWLLVGIVATGVHNWFTANRDNHFAIASYALLAALCLTLEDDSVLLVGALLTRLLAIWAFALLLRNTTRRPSARSGFDAAPAGRADRRTLGVLRRPDRG